MKKFRDFLIELNETDLTEQGSERANLDELYELIQNSDRSEIYESKIIASGIFLKVRNQIVREKDINKKFRLLVDAIALSTLYSIQQFKKSANKEKA